MKKLSLEISYEVYASSQELGRKDRLLLDCAKTSLAKSYSPYSQFKVGAAALLDNEVMLPGANQENASYPLCLCAERNALALANLLHPEQKIVALAVTAEKEDIFVSPCGACRQVIWENEQRGGGPIRLIIRGPHDSVFVFDSVDALLPFGFSGSDLW
jgi:cytidine deaminase